MDPEEVGSRPLPLSREAEEGLVDRADALAFPAVEDLEVVEAARVAEMFTPEEQPDAEAPSPAVTNSPALQKEPLADQITIDDDAADITIRAAMAVRVEAPLSVFDGLVQVQTLQARAVISDAYL